MLIAFTILILILIGFFIAFLFFCIGADSTSSGDEKQQDSSKSSAYTGIKEPEWGHLCDDYERCCANCENFGCG